MRIQHNIMAMNAYRNYNNNTSALSKNLEKLSSGYKINRAGDDAAGLAISEKMRAQITGLDAAQKNVKDGISLVKTAEGAMQEIQDMLRRMDYLATQSANGTYQDEVDREALQKEVNQLKDEINRIADSANFNGIKLLDGSLEMKETEQPVEVPGSENAVQDMIAKGENGATVTTEAAKGASFTAEIKDVANGKADVYRITYTNNAGEEKTLTLASGVAGAAGTAGEGGKVFAGAIKAGTLQVSDTSSNAKGDLEEFTKLFNVKFTTGAANKGTVSFSAKDPNSSAKVTKIEQGQNADVDAALTAGLTDTNGKLEKASGTQAKVEIATGTTGKITIGDKIYEVEASDNAADKVAVAKKLIEQLKDDGFEIEKATDFDTSGTFTIKNLDEAQKGTQITNLNDDKWKVAADESTKGKAKFTITAKVSENAGTAGDAAVKDTRYNYTLSYVNDKGENVKKVLTIEDPTDPPTATSLGDLVAAAINNDSELGEMFKATNNAGAMTIESKGSGTISAYVTGLSSDDLQVGAADDYVKAPKDTGKILSMAKDADGNDYKIKSGDQITVNGKTYEFVKDMGKDVAEGVTKVQIDDDANHATANTWKNLQKALAADGVESELYRKDGTTDVTGLRFTDKANTKTETVTDGGLTLQIGDTADAFNQLRVSVGDMHTKALGIDDLNIGNREDAAKAIDTVKNAINRVSSVRGDLGAYQNRLEHTQNNLSVMAENIQDAESTIRDTDVAAEMMSYVKNNILVQSAQAMLAQANQVPQGVLQLLG